MSDSGERRNIYVSQSWPDHRARRAPLARPRLSRARSRNAQAHLPQSNNLRLSAARTGVPHKTVARTGPVPWCRRASGHSRRILGSLAENGRQTKESARKPTATTRPCCADTSVRQLAQDYWPHSRLFEIQSAYQVMIDRKLSARTVRYAHAVLRAA